MRSNTSRTQQGTALRALRGLACAGLLALLAACAGGPGRTVDDASVHATLAQAELTAGAPAQALQLADQALAAQPDNTAARLVRAEALTRLGQPEAASADYSRVLQRQPDSAAALLGLGRFNLSHDPLTAEGLFRRALASDPGNTAALTDLGIALDLQGRHEAAETAYREALVVQPGLTAARVNLALSLAMRGEARQAIGLLQGLAGDPRASAKLREDYAAVLTMAGEHNRAAAILASDMPAGQAAAAMLAFETGGDAGSGTAGQAGPPGATPVLPARNP
jgi:Flp pilus assembly protein TadD